jgi:PAS domain S-box-containing protein
MMRYWFSPPRRDDAYETFAARVLHYTLLLLLASALVFALFASSPVQLIFIPVVIAIFGGCYYLLHIGQYRLASRIFVSGLWIVITLASFSINGIRNASLSTYAVVIIFSAVLLSSRAAGVFTIISILSAVLLAVGETAGVLPLRATPLFLADRFFQLLALFGATGVLLSAASRVIRTSFQRARNHEQTLLERNQALEIEIAERRRTEASLRISEEKYRLLFENIPVMAAVYAHDGEIILLNNATARFFGGTPETLQGRNIRDVLAPDVAERAIEHQVQVMEESKAMLIEGTIKLLNGREFYYLRHIMPLPNASSPSQVLVLTTDLTEKHLAEQRERELALALEKNAFLTDFFSTVSHDLKTPLTTMNTSLYLLQRAQTPRQQQERIAGIGEQIMLMDKYIQDMLAISRLEHLPTFNFEAVDLNSLIGEIVDLLRMRIEGKHIIQKVIAQPGLPVIQGDAEQLRRMLINLIENAVNYTPDGGQVTVTTSAIKGSVTLEVRDSGIGIEPDAIPHIFERFFRTSKAKAAQSSGTGLGLTIVKKIVETHSASIEVRSQPEQGTTFLVQFPAAFPNNH